ncbi:MAG TPA: FAD-binding oxidoreductase [Acidimicrobiales bacterium]|nr:FAD-binding oxidoreductase [Acidimicrobiales bacterium]
MTRLSGWGRTPAANASVVAPSSEDELAELLARGPLCARGLGRSYGDAAQLAGGTVVDLTGLDEIGPIDESGAVTLGAGASIDDLLALSLPQGWFVPVTPGTRQVTMGGALAADVHGKNHHRDGSFATHVESLRLVTPQGVFDLSTEVDPDLFWATAGGMGLTGIVTRVRLRLLRVESDVVLVDTDRFDDLDAVMAAMVEGDERYRYSVAWVDCTARGARTGRAVLTRGDHAPAGARAPRAPRPGRLGVPIVAPSGLLNPLSVRAFNEAWFRRAPRHAREVPHSLGSFFHPLDGVADWNRLYGPRGFVQYQFVVPDAAGETVRLAVERLARSGLVSFLAVLKRFGPGDPAPLSFPMAGWTLALDLPVGAASLPEELDALDELVIGAGGRVYLAKDARLAPATVAAMYPRLEEWRAVRERVDPDGVLVSDLARRLHLVGR